MSENIIRDCDFISYSITLILVFKDAKRGQFSIAITTLFEFKNFLYYFNIFRNQGFWTFNVSYWRPAMTSRPKLSQFWIYFGLSNYPHQ